MTEHATTTRGLYLGDKKSVISVLDAIDKIVGEARAAMTRHGFSRRFQGGTCLWT